MAGAFGAGQFVQDTTTLVSGQAGPFVPELWSDEIIGPYKANLVLANLVSKMSHVGKKGDTINIPSPARGKANIKVHEVQVTPNVNLANVIQVLLNRHFEYSTLIEDFADTQALASMRKWYVDDAGYSLARRVDWDLHLLGRNAPSATPDPGTAVAGTEYSTAVIGGDGLTVWNPAASANAGNATDLADIGIRKMIRTLDDADVPMSDRCFIIPPIEKQALMGIARFTEQAFVGERGKDNTIRNGLIGDLYANPVYVSTNCAKVLDGAASPDQRAGLYLHKDAWLMIEQQRIRAQAQYKQEYLATLLTWDTIYGVKQIRAGNVVVFITPG